MMDRDSYRVHWASTMGGQTYVHMQVGTSDGQRVHWASTIGGQTDVHMQVGSTASNK